MNFCDIFLEVRSNPKWWNYYGLDLGKIKSDIGTINYADFISKFIKISGKSDNLLYDAIDGLSGTVRPNHIVNTFFLGVYLYNKNNRFKDQIDIATNGFESAFINHNPEERFQFIWFLICLFHDLGYKKEEDSKKMLAIYLNNEIVKLKQSNLGEITGVPTLYKDILNYLDYRKERFACIDHGVYAGKILYRDLCKILNQKLSGQRQRIVNTEDGQLYFCDELKEVYNYAAWIISAHNIFFAKSSSDKKLYKKYKLDKLIIKPDEYPISLNAYPMFYLFCLVDSLEPIKVFRDKELLRSLFLTISDKKLKIRSEIKCGCHSSYFDKVKSLNDWLTPVKLDDRTRTLHIQFNFSLFGCRDVF